jgi:hypothetical protein
MFPPIIKTSGLPKIQIKISLIQTKKAKNIRELFLGEIK